MNILETLELDEVPGTTMTGEIGAGGGFVGGMSRLGIIHFNIRSIQKNFNELLVCLDKINLEKIDIIVLSETFNLTNIELFSINGYEIYYNNSVFNKNDGTIVYVRKNLNPRVNYTQLNQTTPVRVEIIINELALGITAIYRPPSTNLGVFMEEMEKYLSELKRNSVEIIVGDINIDILNGNDKMSSLYMNILGSCGFISYINKPTRVTETTSTLIDHIFVRTQMNIKKNFSLNPVIFKCSMTDHYPVGLELDFKGKIKNEMKTKEFVKTDVKKLLTLLKEENWLKVYERNNVEECYQIFKFTLMNHLSSCRRITRLNNKNKKLKPWITPGLINSIRKRDRMKLDLNKNYSNEMKLQYINYRNFLNKLLRLTKNNYYSNKIKLAKNDSKKIWQIMNEAVNVTKSQSKTECIINEKNEILTHSTDIADSFNNYFSTIGVEMQNEIKKTKKTYKNNITNQKTLFLTPVNSQELIELISTLKNDSSPGDDGIDVKLIKYIHTYLIDPLKYMINLIFEKNEIPQDWKSSSIVPVHKTGDKQILQNYRPIALINNFAKIFEKCLKNRVMNFLETNNTIYKNQYGFRPNLSTEDAIFNLTNEINTNLNANKKNLSVFIDLAKAFDTVPHDKLLEKMEYMGIRGSANLLFKNYLSNRTQRVKIENTYSQVRNSTIGIPQGTVLGPTLFLIYINDIGSILTNGKIIAYADDTVLTFAGSTWQEVFGKAEDGIRNLYSWLNYNLLSINILKTKYITFSISAVDRPQNTILKIHGEDCSNSNCSCEPIQNVDNIKYLGIILDKHLRWNVHCNYINKKMRYLVYRLYQLRDILDKKLLKMVYMSLVESILRYCLVIWGGGFNNSLQNILITQKFILKIIHKKNRTFPTDRLYKIAEVLPLKALYIHACINYLPKIQHLLPKIPAHHTTRSVLLRTHLYIKSHTQRIVTYFAPKFYDKLPINIKSLINNKRQFSIQTKKYIQKNYNTFLDIMKP